MDPTFAEAFQAIFPGQRSIILPRPLLRDLVGIPADLLPCDIGFYPKAFGHNVLRPHGSPQMVFLYCVGGHGWVEIHKKRHVVGMGDLAVLPANVGHAYGSDTDPWTIYWIHACGTRIHDYWNLSGLTLDDPVFPLRDDPGFVPAFEEIYDLLDQGYGPDQLLLAGTGLAQLLGKLFVSRRRSDTASSNPREKIQQAVEWMRRNLALSIRVSDLASMTHLSSSHFAALFRRATGYPVLDYFLRLKMQRACQDLDTTRLSIKVIAAELGFADQLYFSRCFRRVYGLSPSDYRAIRKG